eukprot:7398134-Pyramimonas_sp.AAC.1
MDKALRLRVNCAIVRDKFASRGKGECAPINGKGKDQWADGASWQTNQGATRRAASSHQFWARQWTPSHAP